MLSDARKLRLAARTVLDWRFPAGSAEYQAVLGELLRTSMFARSWYLRPNGRVVPADTEGVLVWHLSGTLETSCPYPREVAPTPEQLGALRERIVAKATAELLSFGYTRGADQPLWPGGPNRFSVAQEIVDSLIYARDDVAAEAMARMLRLCFRAQRPEVVREVAAGPEGAPREPVTPHVYGDTVGFLAAMGFLAFTGLFLMSTLVALVDAWTGSAGSEVLVIALASLLCAGLSLWAFSIPRLPEGIVSARYRAARRLSTERLAGMLDAAMDRVCAEEPWIFAASLDHADPDWRTLALAVTTEASDEMVGEALRALRSPEMDEPSRMRLFLWLCRADFGPLPGLVYLSMVAYTEMITRLRAQRSVVATVKAR